MSGRPPQVRGRFAPSPTGPLHFGSLVAALASYLDARARGGLWLLRIDDLDRPREAPGAADAIVRALDAFGLHWDGAVCYQHRRLARYAEALEELLTGGYLFPCGCTRREAGPGVYPGTCRHGLPAGRKPRSLRFRTRPGHRVEIDDRVRGHCRFEAASTCGDFIVRRADGLIAYHLATVVDDADQGITDVVRGADLLEATVPQVLLAEALGLASPRYAHIVTACGPDGAKLSKQTGAHALDPAAAPRLMRAALAFLHCEPPADHDRCPAMLEWATAHWDMANTPRAREQVVRGLDVKRGRS